MRIRQPARDPADDKNREFLGQLLLLVLKLRLKLFEVHAANEFHCDEKHAARLAKVIRLNNVGVNQIGNELRLTDKILDELFLVGIILANDLDGDALAKFTRA